MGEDAFTEVTKAKNLFEARLIAGRLESEGIPARIPGESVLETLDGIATIWKKGVSVEVPTELIEMAREVLAALPDEGPQDEEPEDD